MSPIDALLLVNHMYVATDTAVQDGDAITTLDVNGDGRLSVHDMRQLIGYVEQMNAVHSRFDSSDLDASKAGVERLLRGIAREDSHEYGKYFATSIVTHVGTAATLPQAEGEASQEACDDWLVGIYVLQHDIGQAENALAEAQQQLDEIEDTLAAMSPGDYPTHEEYEQHRHQLQHP